VISADEVALRRLQRMPALSHAPVDRAAVFVDSGRPPLRSSAVRMHDVQVNVSIMFLADSCVA